MKLLQSDIHPIPYQVRTYYPHLSPPDAALWTTYVKRNPDLATMVYYDFPVGTLPDVDASAQTFNYERYARQTYSKRLNTGTQRMVRSESSLFSLSGLRGVPHQKPRKYLLGEKRRNMLFLS